VAKVNLIRIFKSSGIWRLELWYEAEAFSAHTELQIIFSD